VKLSYHSIHTFQNDQP